MRYSIRNEYRSRIVTRKYIHRLEYIDFRISSIPPTPPTAFPWYDPFHDEGSTNQASQENMIVGGNPLKCLDVDTLNILWVGDSNWSNPPVSDGEYIYTIGYNSNNKMATLDLYDYDGNKIVSYDIESFSYSTVYRLILTYNRVIFVGNKIYFIDRETLVNQLNIVKELDKSNYENIILSDLDYIYILKSGYPKEIYKLDEDGNIVIQSTGATSDYEDVHGIAINDNKIFYDRTLTEESIHICSLDKNTLESFGCVNLNKTPEMVDHIAYYNAHIYVSYRNYISDNVLEFRLCKINASDMSIEWDIVLIDPIVVITQFPNLAIGKDETIYYNTDEKTFAINPDGSIKWKKSLGENLYPASYPVITPSNKLIVMACNQQHSECQIMVLDADTGNIITSSANAMGNFIVI